MKKGIYYFRKKLRSERNLFLESNWYKHDFSSDWDIDTNFGWISYGSVATYMPCKFRHLMRLKNFLTFIGGRLNDWLMLNITSTINPEFWGSFSMHTTLSGDKISVNWWILFQKYWWVFFQNYQLLVGIPWPLTLGLHFLYAWNVTSFQICLCPLVGKMCRHRQANHWQYPEGSRNKWRFSF